MQKPRRGAAGFLLALMLVVPAPILTGCRQGAKVVEQGADDAARQAARNGAKRLGPAGGAAGAGGAGCAASDNCPP
jgi:hypothetical protein